MLREYTKIGTNSTTKDNFKKEMSNLFIKNLLLCNQNTALPLLPFYYFKVTQKKEVVINDRLVLVVGFLHSSPPNMESFPLL